MKRKILKDDMTVEEVMEYEKNLKPVEHVYGVYGTLAKEYLKEHNVGKYWSIEDLPSYLHNVDKQADELYKVMYEKMSKSEKYKKTGDYMSDLYKESEMRSIIREEILTTIVYVK